MVDTNRQAGAIAEYQGRGVWVPAGMTAEQIMVGAKVLEDELDVEHYIARDIVCRLLTALSRLGAGES